MKAIFVSGCFTMMSLLVGASQVPTTGTLWGTGYNVYGGLGIGNSNNVDAPVQITNNVVAIAGGGYHTLFIKSDGSLWTMGDGQSGQLGNSNTIVTYAPGEIESSNVVAISAGEFFSLFLKSDGSMWGMGDNSYGQLGANAPANMAVSPVEIMASNVTAIAAGGYHSLFIKTDGSLWSMGDNSYGQLGNGTNSSSPNSIPYMVEGSNVITIAGGENHTLFIKSDGSLWGVGYDGLGQLGNSNYGGSVGFVTSPVQIEPSNVVAIAGGGTHSLFLKSNGSLWAMGYNYSGQLGDGTTDDGVYATNVPEQIISSNVTAISAGLQHSLYLLSGGSLWAMGNNFVGELGNGSFDTVGPHYGIFSPLMMEPSNVVTIAAGWSESLFLVAVPVVTSPPTGFAITGIAQQQVTLQFSGNSNADYTVLDTSNLALPLVDWTVLGSAALLSNNLFQFIDTNATNIPARFYMLRSP
jgi:alpha-tubulin suppressor-like RCC1 family protein